MRGLTRSGYSLLLIDQVLQLSRVSGELAEVESPSLQQGLGLLVECEGFLLAICSKYNVVNINRLENAAHQFRVQRQILVQVMSERGLRIPQTPREQI